MEKFIIGVALGGIAGAVLTANSYKMRMLVKKGQEEVQAKLDKLMDEKIEMMEEGVETLKAEAKEKIEEVKEKKPKVFRKAALKNQSKEGKTYRECVHGRFFLRLQVVKLCF